MARHGAGFNRRRSCLYTAGRIQGGSPECNDPLLQCANADDRGDLLAVYSAGNQYAGASALAPPRASLRRVRRHLCHHHRRRLHRGAGSGDAGLSHVRLSVPRHAGRADGKVSRIYPGVAGSPRSECGGTLLHRQYLLLAAASAVCLGGSLLLLDGLADRSRRDDVGMERAAAPPLDGS